MTELNGFFPHPFLPVVPFAQPVFVTRSSWIQPWKTDGGTMSPRILPVTFATLNIQTERLC